MQVEWWVGYVWLGAIVFSILGFIFLMITANKNDRDS